MAIDNFRNRRRMAWSSFAVLCAITGIMGFRLAMGDNPESWTGIATMCLGCFTSIVGAYAITATVEKNKDVEPPEK